MRRYARLAPALLVSLLAHALTLVGVDVMLPQTPAEPSALNVRLNAATPAPDVISPPATAVRQKPARRTPPPPSTPFREAPAVQLPTTPPAYADTAGVPEAQSADAGTGSQDATPQPPVVVATAPASTLITDPPAADALPPRTLPRRGRITYNLLLGTDGFSVGQTVQTWEARDGSYLITSLSETTGVVELMRSERRAFESRGTVTAAGLVPQHYLSTRTRRGNTDRAEAAFDWERQEVRLGRSANTSTAPLTPGSQDLLSFPYQLSLHPPQPGRLQLKITNGSRLETYEMDVLPVERIDTPLGPVAAVPLRQVRKQGEESIEIWLATEYRHLPVRIRFIGRDGTPTGEQLVSALQLSEE